MSRSKWKGPYIGYATLKNKDLKKKQLNLVLSRNTEITPLLVGLTFKIHNGKEYPEITVTYDMVGCKFGEFVFTRGKFSFKKKKNKK
jgi:small subunit ribosomal protein S19